MAQYFPLISSLGCCQLQETLFRIYKSDLNNMTGLGLFEPSHMKYEADREDETGDWREPSLAEMTKKSLDILKQSPDGYFLLVEG